MLIRIWVDETSSVKNYTLVVLTKYSGNENMRNMRTIGFLKKVRTIKRVVGKEEAAHTISSLIIS